MLKRLFYQGPSRAILHEKYAKQGRIDEAAPIQTSSTVDINAPVGRVWELITDLPAWPQLDPSYRGVRLESTLSVDAYFRFVLNNFPIRGQFAIIEPERELTWTGVSLWFKAVDVHRVEPLPGGGTRLFIAESLAGVLAPLFISSRQLQAQHDQWLAAIKRAAENKSHASSKDS